MTAVQPRVQFTCTNLNTQNKIRRVKPFSWMPIRVNTDDAVQKPPPKKTNNKNPEPAERPSGFKAVLPPSKRERLLDTMAADIKFLCCVGVAVLFTGGTFCAQPGR